MAVEPRRFSTHEARLDAGIDTLGRLYLYFDRFYGDYAGSWAKRERGYVSDRDPVETADLASLQGFTNLLKGLMQKGLQGITIADMLLTRAAGELQGFHRDEDPFRKSFNDTVASLENVRFSATPSESVLTYDPDMTRKVSDTVAIAEEDVVLDLPLAIGTTTGKTLRGAIGLAKNHMQAAFSIGDLTQGNPQSPLQKYLEQYPYVKDTSLRGKIADKIYRRYSEYGPGKQRREEELASLRGSKFISEMLHHVVCSKDGRLSQRRAIYAFHGLAIEGLIDEAERERIHADIITYLDTSLKQARPEVTVTKTIALEDEKEIPTIEYQTKKGLYRVSMQKQDSDDRLVITSVPLSDKHATTQQRIEEGLQVINTVVSHFLYYLDAVPASIATLRLPPELEKASKVDLVELTEEDLQEDLAHIGGLPEVTQSTINNFVNGTLAYSRGDSDTKPNSILLTGETGSGKSTVSAAVAKEFVKAGILVFRIGQAETITPPNLVRALQTFQANEKGGILVIDDLQDYFRGNYKDVVQARAALLQIVNDINNSPTHSLIFNTESVTAVVEEREALAQSHRLDVVPCNLELSDKALYGLLQAVVARFLTKARTNPVAKSDPMVDKELERLSDRQLIEWILYLLDVGEEYKDTAPLSPGIMVGAFKAAQWETNNSTAINKQLTERMLPAKKEIRVQARLAKGETTLDRVRIELAEIAQRLTAVEHARKQKPSPLLINETAEESTPEALGETDEPSQSRTHRLGGEPIIE